VPGGESFLAALVEHAPVGVLLLSSDFRIRYANQAASQLVAVPLPATPPSILSELVLPEDADALRIALARHQLSDRKSMSVEIRFLRDGMPVWMLASISAVHWAGPDYVADIFVQLTDIDQRKREELERHIWEERWNSALVSSTLGVWDHDFKNGTMYYSDTWKLLRGMEPHEEVDSATDNWLQSVHPDDRERVLECIRRQNDGEVSSSIFEYRERHKDGRWVWIECRGSCIEWDANGKPTRIVGTDLDVTARKTIEEQFAHVSRRLELAFAVTRIGVFEADLTDKTLLLDDRLLAIMDMEGAPHLQGADDWEYVLHPEDRQRAKEHIDQSVGNSDDFSNQFRIIRRDGSIRHIRARVAPFEDNSGHMKLIGANWDVTDDITIRQELERAKLLAEARNRELELAKAKIEHNALHDFLTNLPNRRYLDDKLAHRDQSSSTGLAILHVDLDRFKQINDTLGHQAGDSMLLYAADVLRENVGPEGFVARIGGDEFVVLVDYDGTSEPLERLADKIITRMREPVQFNGMTCRIGASIGIAFDHSPDVDAKQLLLNADIALYRAKGSGRNRHEFFSIDIHNQVVNNKRISDEILAALENREFIPYYQLQFCARTLEIVGVETLARWNHPVKGVLTPDRFLTIAEDLDAVEAIDAMILEKALIDLALWEKAGVRIPKISANVSMRRLYDANLGAKLAASGIRPGSVSFELLETIFLDDFDDVVIQNLETMRAMGIGIEIDDFGTGHASIMSLLKVNPGTLKIDRALIQPLVETPEQRKLVGSIIEIGKSLGIRVVAEGVESWEHVRILQSLGCDVLQGFALARPMPFEGIESYVFQQKWRQP
jgi:diguanylate cyclase (GGDEF)-like protein/PAS domain S-box-containing protein